MDSDNRNRKLLFFRRMTWWLPPLAFAVWLAVLWLLGVQTGAMQMMTAVLNAFVGAVIVGVLVWGGYFLYKYMLDKNPSM